MTEIERLTTRLGELAYTEIEEVTAVNYTKNKTEELTDFDIVMKTGNRYRAEIKEI